VDPRAVNIKSEGRSEKTKKRPIEPVIDDIATVNWTFKTCEVWHDRFIGHGGIIKRKRTGKKPVTGNAMGIGRMSIAKHQHQNETSANHPRPPSSKPF